MLAAITSRRLNVFSGPYVEIKEIESIVTKYMHAYQHLAYF